MGVAVPTALPSASGWQFYDWTEVQGSAAAVDGVAVVELDQLDPGEMWLIDRAVIVCDSDTDTAARLYVDGVDPSRIRSGSAWGNFDEAEYPSGLLLRPSSRLVARWDGCSAGATAALTLQARVYRRA